MDKMYAILFVAIGIVIAVQAQFSPPVNEPNDCPIRCITTPCPCGATCPKLSCPGSCDFWKLDTRGCNTCECAGAGEITCPLRKCKPCTNGFKYDRMGCRTCECFEAPCPVPLCRDHCPNGYKRNDRGCQTCSCVESPKFCNGGEGCDNACPYGYERDVVTECITCTCKLNPIRKCRAPQCLVACQHGSRLDERGCDTCDCLNCPAHSPCAVVRCASGTPTVITSPRSCPTCQCVPDNKPVEKPGSCPAPVPGQFGVCVARCGTDSECPGDEKCCGGCPRECVKPDTKPVVKPGSCPVPIPGLVGACVARCGTDSECQGDEKCCGSCPRECLKPVTKPAVKAGRCPRRPPSFIGTCDVRCQGDNSCPGDQKCCGGCPTKCEDPMKELPSTERCPRRLLRPYCPKGRKADRCSANTDCRRGKICCGFCGKRCVRPSRRRRN